jgi:hypothetical protein
MVRSSSVRMRVAALSVVFFLTAACFAASAAPPDQQTAAGAPVKPKVLVVVQLREPDFTILEMKYRVFYNKGETKKIPLTDYDFKVAFTDELLNALAEDSRAEWLEATGQEGIDVVKVWDKKATVPAGVAADRLLLVDIVQYGALVADLAADKFTLQIRMRLTDKTGRQKLWEKGWYERNDLPGKVADLQADNQKGLKEGINQLVEEICQKIRLEIKKARF